MDTPKKQQFAFNNIQMNMSKSDVEKTLNKPKRVTFNEYGTKWYMYYDDDYNNFIMISYIKDKVNALYTNQNIITSKSKIKYNTPKSVVRQRLGEPETEIVKGRGVTNKIIKNMMFSIKITFIRRYFMISIDVIM